MAHQQEVARRWHMCTSALIRITGTTATGESYGITVATSGDGDLVDSIYGGRYLVELAKRNEEWRISKCTYVLDWSQRFPNSLEAMKREDFALKILQIREPGHPMYRPL